AQRVLTGRRVLEELEGRVRQVDAARRRVDRLRAVDVDERRALAEEHGQVAAGRDVGRRVEADRAADLDEVAELDRPGAGELEVRARRRDLGRGEADVDARAGDDDRLVDR